MFHMDCDGLDLRKEPIIEMAVKGESPHLKISPYTGVGGGYIHFLPEVERGEWIQRGYRRETGSRNSAD